MLKWFGLESKGKLVYDPEYFKKATKPAKWWLILETDQGLVEYYNHTIRKRVGINMLKPSWGSHISIIRGEEVPDSHKHLWEIDNNKIVTFQYSPHIRFNDEYWWIDVQCEKLLDLRESLGLIRKPYFSFHITVGKLPIELRGKIKFNDLVL